PWARAGVKTNGPVAALATAAPPRRSTVRRETAPGRRADGVSLMTPSLGVLGSSAALDAASSLRSAASACQGKPHRLAISTATTRRVHRQVERLHEEVFRCALAAYFPRSAHSPDQMP